MAFNIRVYGILINDENEVLLSDECRFGKQFTKFPGGGLEEGEGIKDCLIREFQEELNISIKVGKLFYLTDFYQESTFDPDDQIISIYYLIETKDYRSISCSDQPLDFDEGDIESHRWIKIDHLDKDEVTFPIDKIVVEKLITRSN